MLLISESARLEHDGSRCWGVADDGAVVEIATPETAFDALTARWPPLGLAQVNAPPGPVTLRLEAEAHSTADDFVVIVDGQPAGGGWDRFESELALFSAERLAGLVAVHAAVIIRGSAALLVPGTSGAGKSTLCVAAAAAGARVLTDEYALVDPLSGRVSGWRRPVRVRRPDGGVDRLDLAVASDPVPVGLVALVTHQPGSEQSWAPVSGAEAVLGILANTVCAQSRADESLDAALVIARSAHAVAGLRGEAEIAIVELLDMLDNHVDDADRHPHHDSTG